MAAIAIGGALICALSSSGAAALMMSSGDEKPAASGGSAAAVAEVKKNSSYIKSAYYKCGGYAEVDVTKWFKTFVDKIPSGDDKSKYLCSTSGKYNSVCTNGGTYPGSMVVFDD